MANQLPAQALAPYDDDIRENALFHYTTGAGLQGILCNRELWSTAYFCTNDESELSSGQAVLMGMFKDAMSELWKIRDVRVEKLVGWNLGELPATWARVLIDSALRDICIYMTCFCKANDGEDFQHGLLSQWRGYGIDGGYALQFNRSKLEEWTNTNGILNQVGYVINDIYYDAENRFKNEVLKHAETFKKTYTEYLKRLIDLKSSSTPAPISVPVRYLMGGPLEALLDYMAYTKSAHFREERECRVTVLDVAGMEGDNKRPVDYFNRGGLLVPFVRTPPNSGILDCIDSILVGPGHRIEDRCRAVRHLLRRQKLSIEVRHSGIPYSRTAV